MAHARKVVTRSPKRKVGYINCKWFQNSPIEHESQTEKRFVKSALLLPGLFNIEHQPFTLELKAGKYTPDFLLRFPNEKVVVEIKIRSKVRKYHEIFNEASQKLAESGFSFFVVTQHDLNFGSRSEVAAEILRYAKSEVAEVDANAVLAHVPDEDPISLGDLIKVAASTREVILSLIARRRLAIGLDDFVEDEASVSKPSLATKNGVAVFEERFLVKPWNANTALAPTQAKSRPRLAKRPRRATGPYVRGGRARDEQSERSALSVVAGGLHLIAGRQRHFVSESSAA